MNRQCYVLRNTKISICQMHYDVGWNSSVQKVYKFHSQQLIAAALQVTPSKLYDIFHHTLIVTSNYYYNIMLLLLLSRAGPGRAWISTARAGPGRQNTKLSGRAGPKFRPCRTLQYSKKFYSFALGGQLPIIGNWLRLRPSQPEILAKYLPVGLFSQVDLYFIYTVRTS